MKQGMKHGKWLCCLLLPASVWAGAALAAPQAEAGVGETGAGAGGDYLLGYQVYLARGNLAAAYQVARKALQAQPNDTEWMKRFAQSAEWVGKPAEALDVWLRLAQKTGNKEAWTAVGRLAPGLVNDDAQLAYQQQLLKTQGPKDPLVISIAQTYERMGRPEEGLAFLDSVARRNPTPKLLDAEATLAEHAGQDERARNLLSELIDRYGPQEGWLLRRAALHYSRGDLTGAWSELKAVEGSVPPTAVGYWQTYAELSRLLNHSAESRHAYDVLVKSGKATPDDLGNYAALLQNQDAGAAARLNESLFRQYGRDPSLMTALYLYIREGNTEAAGRLLAKLTPEQLARLEKDPDFLDQRGQYYWRLKRLDLAQADFSRGLQLAPRNVHLLEALVAVLTEADSREALSRVLQSESSRAMAEPQLWSVWAAGWNALDQPRKALPYRQAYCRANPRDKLGLLALADTYTRLGDTESASRLQHRVFGSQVADNETPGRMAALSDALFALRLSQAAPEPGLNMLRSRLKKDKQGRYPPAARDLALSWLLAHQNNERAWKLVSTSYEGEPPPWLQSGAAISQGDRNAMRKLLERDADRLPPGDRVELALQTDRPQLAESLAYAGAEANPDDDEQAKRLQRLYSQRGHWVELSGLALRQGVLERDGASLAFSTPIAEHWRLDLEGAHYSERSHNTDQLAQAPKVDRFGVLLTQQSENNRWYFGASHHEALEGYQGFVLGQAYRYHESLSLGWHADYHADAPESAALLAGGDKDQLVADLNWALSTRDSVGAELSAMRFQGQTGQSLGSGGVLTLDYVHHLQTDGLQQDLRLAGTTSHFDADDGTLDPRLALLVPAGQAATPRFFVPEGYHQIALFWDVGNPTPDVYERRWRGFGGLGVSYANTTGSGYSARLGLHGPVLGHDRLTLSVEQDKGGQDNGDITRRAVLTYRYFY